MRDNNIDLLRFIGLSLVILAHVSPPPILLNIRCFDVPLMVLVSGMTCYGRSADFSFSYLVRRFTRLVFPVWIFLTLYFAMILGLEVVGIDSGLTLKHVVGSYLLWEGIGYVWIIRVFLMMALITPLLISLNNAIKRTVVFVSVFCAALLIFLFVTAEHIGYNTELIINGLYYIIGYGFLFWLGIRVKDLTQKASLVLVTIMLLAFAVLCCLNPTIKGWNIFLHINDYKYPPTNVFVVYGIIISILLYMLVSLRKKTILNPLVSFISRNSIWIYLWHIPIVSLMVKMDFLSSWMIKYAIAYVGALCLYTVQYKIVNTVENKHQYRFLKYLRG